MRCAAQSLNGIEALALAICQTELQNQLHTHPMKLPPLTSTIQETANAFLAAEIKKAGLRIEDNFRVSDEGIGLSYAAIAIMKRSGFPADIPGNESVAGMGLPRDGSFWHPLSESFDEKESGVAGGAMNMWASASLLTNVALGWVESSDISKPLGMVKESVGRVAPTVSLPALMDSARYSDPALLKLVGLVKDGLDAAMAEAFKKQA